VFHKNSLFIDLVQPELDLTHLSGLARQSSAFTSPTRALDGDTNGYFSSGKSCSHTLKYGSTDPWWTVPLQGRYIISQVNIYNRVDGPTGRLGPVDVYVEDSGVQKLCGSYACDTTDVEVVDVMCFAGTVGDRIRIVAPGPNRILTICELVAFGKQLP